MSLNESSFPGHAQREAERIREDGEFHRERFGQYCPYCGAGEFDCERAFKKHLDRCKERRNERSNGRKSKRGHSRDSG